MPTRRLKNLHPLLARFLALEAHQRLQYFVVPAGLLAMTANSLPDLPPARAQMLAIVLWTCLAYFASAWAWRIWQAIGSSTLSAYFRSGVFFSDALAVLPVPLALSAGLEPATAWLFGAFWMLNIAARSPGLTRLGRVISVEAKPLASVLVIFFTVLLFAATMLHLLEREAQPAAFGSLPASLWWAIATLTTVGYGDAVPHTNLGRIIAGMVMICGVGVFGLLTGILATGFVDDSRRHNFMQNWQVVKNVPFFRSLDPAGIIEISRLLRRLDLSEDSTVVRRGREGDCMYFVGSGEVEVEVDPPIRLGPGAFFGEMALLGSGIRGATVVTTLPTTLLVLEQADFRAFTASHPGLYEAIEAEATRRGAPHKSNVPPREITSPPISQ